MHVYIYDDYLDKSKYNRAINRLEIRLTDLGLNGKIIRLGGIKNIKIAIQNELRLGAKTIIAVGNNQTINKIIGAIIDTDIFGDFQKKTLLGIIPIGDDNSIANSLGIKNYEEACNILLARRIEKIDLGLAGQHYFLNHASITGEDTSLELDGYTIETSPKTEIIIINLLSGQKGIVGSNPHDGLLDIYIKSRHGYDTHLRSSSFTITNQNKHLLVDNVLEIQTPVKLGVVRDRVNVIVGKDRSFE
jgi:hypothetical protein